MGRHIVRDSLIVFCLILIILSAGFIGYTARGPITEPETKCLEGSFVGHYFSPVGVNSSVMPMFLCGTDWQYYSHPQGEIVNPIPTTLMTPTPEPAAPIN